MGDTRRCIPDLREGCLIGVMACARRMARIGTTRGPGPRTQMHHGRPLVLDLLIRRGQSAPRNAPAVDSPEAAVTFQKGASGPRQSVGERFRYEASAGGS